MKSDVRRVRLVNQGKYGYQCTMCYKIYDTREDIGEHLAEKEYKAIEESK